MRWALPDGLAVGCSVEGTAWGMPLPDDMLARMRPLLACWWLECGDLRWPIARDTARRLLGAFLPPAQ